MPPNLITLTDPGSPAADAYRTLRTNLIFSDLDHPIATLGISAPAEDSGKGLTAANLAVTFAQSERRTILVDADLRRPSIHTYWDADNSRGLTTMLLEDAAFDTPPLIETEVEGLRLLPSGTLPANPVDVLASARMDQVIRRLMESADMLVFDMPPVLVAADALVLGQKLDGMLMVVRANHTRRDHTTQARLQLERVSINLLGAVLVDAPYDRTSSDYR
ncbi:MAG: CpsD/CapB family tyrosine-protein kinase [Chloroflexi bacterium]|nr:CpsD/CapB family tyrosine-protein kinase [Chloroflexota bacterium]